MDYRSDKESWGWQGHDYYLEKGTNVDMPNCAWNGVTQNEEDLSYIFAETTPIKACGDLPCHNKDSDIMTKTPQDCKEYSSQVKRRRILDFDSAREDISSAFLKSKERIDAVDGVLSDMSEWEACFQGDMGSAGFEDLYQSEAWLAECLNDTDINMSSDDGNVSVASDALNSVKDSCDVAPHSTPNTIKRAVRSSRNIIFRGKKSYMRAPTRLASSVTYPFDFIKPCEVRGDVTLKDINQKIRTPPLSDSKEGKDDTSAFPTSAFSGKPVVGKTKIPTQGGKGSITIMRTKG